MHAILTNKHVGGMYELINIHTCIHTCRRWNVDEGESETSRKRDSPLLTLHERMHRTTAHQRVEYIKSMDQRKCDGGNYGGNAKCNSER